MYTHMISYDRTLNDHHNTPVNNNGFFTIHDKYPIVHEGTSLIVMCTYILFRMYIYIELCMLEVLIDYLTMPQQVIKPNCHMAFLTDKSLIHCNKLAILLYCVTTYVCTQ